MKKIYTVLVTFNEGQKAVECLKSFQQIDLKNSNIQLKIVVVDNASTNDTGKMLKKLQLELIENNENLGFAAASNIGIKKALKMKADYVLLLNPDTTVAKNFLKPLLNVLRRPKVGICGPKILFEETKVSQKPKIWSSGGIIDPKRFSGGLMGYREEDHGQYDKEKEVDYISGTCKLVKRTVFEKIGLLREDFFLYYDDVDFCLRARKAGFKIVYVPSSVIYHYGSFTIGQGSKVMQYYLARNRLYFLQKNAPLLVKIRELVRLPKTFFEHFKKGEIAALLGIKDYFLRKRGIKRELHSRRGPTSVEDPEEVGPRLEVCRLCQSKDVKVFLPRKNFQLLKCANCGVIFTDPFPSKKAFRLINKQKYGKKDLWQGYSSRLPTFFKKAQDIVAEIKTYKSAGHFLDIGCGFGVLLKAAKDQGFKVLGIEKEKTAGEIAKKKWKIPIAKGEFPKIELQPGSFDVVTCFDILEHVEDFKQFLSSIYKILKKNGLFVVQVPNIQSMMFYLTKHKWNWLVLPNHLWHFSPRTLSMVLKAHGFKILKIKTFDDLSEFNFNLIDALGVKKSDFLSRVVWKTLRIGFFGIAPISFFWSKLGKGGLIRVYAQR